MYPDYMDALTPLASAPVKIVGLNRMFRAMIIKRVRRGRYILIPTSDETRGHGTHSRAVV
jgi:hypothetical protein